MDHVNIINLVIQKFNFKNYLEIGVGNGENFNNTICENKESCDPYNVGDLDGKANFDITYPMASDEMFESISSDKKWDIIFIDGLHEGNQVLRDICNSLKHISENGFIFIHDSLPESAEYVNFPRDKEGTWNGTVYKAYPVLLEENIDFCIVDIDFGIGVIRGNQKFKSNECPKESEMTWEDIFETSFINNYKIISIMKFMIKTLYSSDIITNSGYY